MKCKIGSFLILALLMNTIMLGAANFIHPSSAQVKLPVPREEAVICETDTAYTVWDKANPFIPMGTQWGSGWHQVCQEWDWYINYATGEIIYWRITGWEYSDDCKTFTMHIRRGVKWNDGVPYTSKDIAFTMNMLKANPTLFGAAYVNEWVESVETPDDYTVIIHLKKPNPMFHHTFRMWGPFNARPEHVWKDKDPKEFANWPPVETGPYKLYKTYPELNMFIWERDEDYWAKEVFGLFPAPKYVIWRYAPPPDIDLADFVHGMVDAPLPHLFSWDMIKMAMRLTTNITLAPYLDPCPLGISTFNCEKYPLNITEVRWAIALCLNKEKLAALYPMAEKTWVSPYPWPIPQYAIFDKYKPIVERVLERIESELGVKYEYNPTKAAAILDSLGFIDRDGDGIRETPNGTKLSLEILSRPVTVVQEYYIAADLAEELRKIGIDATVRTVDPAMWHELTALGDYEIAVGSLCSSAWLPGEIVYMLDDFHSKWYVPIGERSVGGGVHGANPRYRNPELDEIVDELWTLRSDDPRAQELIERGIYIIMRDMLSAPAVEKMFVQVFSTAYWEGWPSEKNMYHVPYIWWPEFIFVLFSIKPRALPPAISYVGAYFLKDVEAFTGVDGKIYGPFTKGEFAMIPKDDAERLVAQGLASYSPPTPAELTEIAKTVSDLSGRVSRIETTVTDLSSAISDLRSRVDALSAQIASITTVIEGIGIVTIILVIVAIVMIMRKK